MGLPTPILRLMSGGKPVVVGGRTLDAQTQVMAHAARKAPPIEGADPLMVRAGAAQGFALAGGTLEPGVTTEDFELAGPGGPLPVRAYRPAEQDPQAPVFVYLHMGGGIIGDLDTGHAFCSMVARAARCPVLSVHYRLAPEHKHPAGLDDSLFAYRWARDNADRFGAPVGKAAVGGDSMGGNFSAIIAQDLRAANEPQPVVQALIYPAVDVASDTASMTTYADAYPLSRAMMDWFMGHYLGEGATLTDVRLSPDKADSVEGLAPAVVVTAGFDPLNDQGAAYADRLRAAGVPVTYRCHDSLCHGFIGFTGAIKAADAASREVAALIADAYAGHFS